MYVMGINSVFHDLSVCLLKDGVILMAAEEERFFIILNDFVCC